MQLKQLKQICKEILNEAKKKNINDSKSFNKIKLQVLSKYHYNKIPKNATIASLASEKDRKLFKKILSMKPVRTISGVAPIALMTDPYPCPHTIKGTGPCTYCPGGPGSPFGNVPQSYTGKEPSTRRAIRNSYDPYLGVFNRLEHYVAMNSVPEKTEVILQGGTFPFYPKAYQEYFVKYLLKAMNDFSRLFYTKDSTDMKKFNKFFEMPADINDKERTKRIHKKLFFIKNLNLSNKKILNSVNYLFFNNNFDIFLIKNNVLEKHSFSGRRKSKAFSSEIKDNTKNEIIKQWKKFNGKNNNNFNNIIDNLTKNNKNQKTIISDNLIGKNNNELKINGKNNDNAHNADLNIMKALAKKVNVQNNSHISLEQMQKENETAKIRCIGLTIETKSDYGKLIQGNQILKLGCTRVELGVQSIYDKVLEKTNRGNTVKDNIESIKILKDLGFKINLHYMPGLPYTTKEMDRIGLKELFANPDYRPDMLKIYPCMVMPGTKLYEDWKAGKFTPLTTKKAASLITTFKKYVPEYCRIMRVQRDIPTYITSSGVDRTNLRQYVDKLCKQRNIKCRCIRCREVGLNTKKTNLKNIKIKTTEYKASKGKEFFIAAEDKKNDVLFGFCRLRFPSQFLRKEITKDSALVRELHMYSPAVQIGKKSDDSFQHRGIGKKLLKKAEEIALKNKKNKVVVISGIGARQYFAKLGYKHDGHYMSKIIN